MSLRYHIRLWWAWRRQGRPTNEPVVMQEGIITYCPHGHGLVTNWHWNTHYQRCSIELSELIDRYSARYPQHRTPFLAGCTFCRASQFHLDS